MNSDHNKENKKNHDQEKRQTQIGKRDKNSGIDRDTRSLGDASVTRSETGDNEVGIGRKISERRDLSGSPAGEQILGGTISQLIAKAEDQLAVLESSAKETKKYISELRELLTVIEKNPDKLM